MGGLYLHFWPGYYHLTGQIEVEQFKGQVQIRESEDCKTDADLALLLLKFFKRWQTGSTPSKKRPRPQQPPVSSVTEDSDL
ncbi:unnamed protein product [Arctogadus glacialis]